jgi:hypothetical protein
MYVLSGMLFVGLLCNLLIRPVDERHYMSEEQLSAERRKAHEQTLVQHGLDTPTDGVVAGNPSLVIAAWTAIAIPLGWGVWITLSKSLALLR